MLIAVKFDYQPRIGTTEINDIPALGNLSFEFKTINLSIAQLMPKLMLDIRLRASEFPGELCFHRTPT